MWWGAVFLAVAVVPLQLTETGVAFAFWLGFRRSENQITTQYHLSAMPLVSASPRCSAVIGLCSVRRSDLSSVDERERTTVNGRTGFLGRIPPLYTQALSN